MDLAQVFEAVQEQLLAMAGSPWLYPALLALVVLDAFLVIVPSETAVVALGAVAASSGQPSWLLLVAVAAVGAIIGDQLCYLLGRAIGDDRWRWMRRPRIAAAIGAARRTLDRRAAVVLLTARYIPFARIAVNLTAGATRFHHGRFTALTALAGGSWAVFNAGLGAGVGAWLGDQPLAAVLVSVPVAIALGLGIDLGIRRIAARRAAHEGEISDGDPV